MTPQDNTDDEVTYACPIDGCDAAMSMGALRLHVMMTEGDGHGPKAERPDGISLDHLTPVEAATESEGEKVVKCPVEGCDAEKLARGMHLHVRQSVGDGHGKQGEIPEGVSFDDLEVVGTREVVVDYPEERKVESVARLCPYCGVPFKGKNGVLIHLGQVAGRKNHPLNASKVHEPDDFPVVELDDDENVVGVMSRRVKSLEVAEDGSEDRRTPEGVILSPEEIRYVSRVLHEQTNDSRAKLIMRKAGAELLCVNAEKPECVE